MPETFDFDDPASNTYAQLRQMAHRRLYNNSLRSISSTTSLVHDAILKLKSLEELRECKDIGRFRCLMAYAMRSILVDRARRRIVEWNHLKEYLVATDLVAPEQVETEEKYILLDQALVQMSQFIPDSAMVIHLRFFLQLTFSEIAEQLEISERTAIRYWSFGRSWLRRYLDNRIGS